MQKILKIATIGCGGISQGKHLLSLKKLDQVEIAAFCDTNIENAKNAGTEFGTTDAKYIIH